MRHPEYVALVIAPLVAMPFKRAFGILLSVLALGAQAWAGPLDDAGAAYARGDYTTALQLYGPLADQGDASAQFVLSFMYDTGKGVPENNAEAVKWYRLAADQGDAVAQSKLGIMYAEGQGVPQNDAEAVKWFRLAADQGEVVAQVRLGLMYDFGRGVPENDSEAVKSYRLAADQGDTEAQSYLGMMYATGQGVPEDYVQAYKWIILAFSRFPASEKETREDLVGIRDAVRTRMTAAQIAEAQKLASEWKPQPAGAQQTNPQLDINPDVTQCLAGGAEVTRTFTTACRSGLACVDRSVHPVGVTTCIN